MPLVPADALSGLLFNHVINSPKVFAGKSFLAMIRSGWEARADRGAEERLAVRNRAPLVPASSLKKDPHLEMHTRGG